jgi:hypothetical protein
MVSAPQWSQNQARSISSIFQLVLLHGHPRARNFPTAIPMMIFRVHHSLLLVWLQVLSIRYGLPHDPLWIANVVAVLGYQVFRRPL